MPSPPGWYPDPGGAPVLRAWDGYAWTPHVVPYPHEEPPLLDRDMAALATRDPQPWGLRPVLLPLAAYAVALSSAIFALGHTYDAGSVGGAVVLALDVGLIGLVNCVLVRYTARLAPGMLAHGIVNLAAVAVIAAGVTSS